MPQASSGWSRLACATMASYVARSMFSTSPSVGERVRMPSTRPLPGPPRSRSDPLCGHVRLVSWRVLDSSQPHKSTYPAPMAELDPALSRVFSTVLDRNPGEAEFHQAVREVLEDRKSTRLNSSHYCAS